MLHSSCKTLELQGNTYALFLSGSPMVDTTVPTKLNLWLNNSNLCAQRAFASRSFGCSSAENTAAPHSR
ncbi:hypothetical protein EYF80_042640 [Liparis tanakae]|uniref:Uncharacterized protein n=1 Tax=Liparis tanakae TaxID=230148 RepID=A0A4Z2G0Q5_9TELE|nr:hypothetical protein EYF80_042640 [Liparis tanakae]